MMEAKPEYCPLLGKCRTPNDTDDVTTQTDPGSRGASTIIGRWPKILSSAWVIAIGLLFLFLTTLLVICLCLILPLDLASHDMHMIFTVKSMCSAPLSFSGSPISYTLPPYFERTDIPQLSRRDSPLDNFFYIILNDPDAMTPRQMCAIESTASTNSIKNCYVLYLTGIENQSSSMNWTGPQLSLSDLLRTYSNLKQFELPAKNFFRGSPIEGNWSKMATDDLESLKFVARVLALWRFGGISYDTKLVNINSESTLSLQENSLGMVVEPVEGYVLSAREPCEAFLFEIINTLKTAWETKAKSDLDADSLMDQTIHVYCGDNKDMHNCPGVAFLPSADICKETEESLHNECVWIKHNVRMAKQWKPFCPITHNLLKKFA